MLKKTILFIGLCAASSFVAAEGYKRFYEVTITNITKGQTFTPQLIASHTPAISLFTLGSVASPELEVLAEGGSTEGITTLLQNAGHQVGDIQTIPGLLAPGQSVSMTLEANPSIRQFSLAAMLIPTNDTFVALNSGKLPRRGSKTFMLSAYDAGTEFNDQKCINIPGPRCGGEGHSPEPLSTDEGFIHVSNGFHDLGSQDAAGNEILKPFTYDWRNSVARVVVKRVY